MTKEEIANFLIKKQSINNINELHDLYCMRRCKKEKGICYSWDCKTCVC